MDIKSILAPIGLVMMALALAMIAPAIADIAANNDDWRVFTISCLLSGTVGAALFLGFRIPNFTLKRREAILFIVLVWVMAGIVGALPFYFAVLPVTVTEAMFESISGLTTTGATVLSGLDTMAPGILVWRSMLHWIGGIGIVVFSIFLFPFLSVGGQQLFAMESSEKADRPFAKFRDYTLHILQLYCALTFACMLGFLLAGMDGFDAFNHSLATVSSGGFSTSDGSIGHFGSEAVLWVAIVFMLAAGLPFVWMLRLFTRQGMADDPQVRAFFGFLIVGIVIMVIVLRSENVQSDYSLLATAAFHLVSIVTTTGFAAEDYSGWPTGILSLLFFATFLGACSGSTSGGLKFFRLVLMFQCLKAECAQAIYPKRVLSAHYGSARLEPNVFRGALFFLAAYLLVYVIGAILLAISGLDLVTSLSGSIAALANVGPGLGAMIGPAGNYADVSSFAQWVLIILMILGRLEIIALFVVLLPSFWRS